MEALPENSLDAFEEEGEKQQEIFNRLVEQEGIRVHKVFAQNQDGIELLNKWKHQLIMVPTVQPGSTQFEAGIAEGIKQFVRNLILQIDKIETSGE